MRKSIIYYNPQCSKCRQTKSLLDERGIDYTIVEYLVDTPSAVELTSILEKLGKQAIEIVRVKEALFSELGLSVTDERSDAEWIQILVDNPKLIERPIVIHNDKAAVCRPAEDVLGIL